MVSNGTQDKNKAQQQIQGVPWSSLTIRLSPKIQLQVSMVNRSIPGKCSCKVSGKHHAKLQQRGRSDFIAIFCLLWLKLHAFAKQPCCYYVLEETKCWLECKCCCPSELAFSGLPSYKIRHTGAAAIHYSTEMVQVRTRQNQTVQKFYT
jgi:hypothetical protein